MVAKRPDEELWYHRIVKNFILPRDADLLAQPSAGAGKLFPYCLLFASFARLIKFYYAL
ncbi:hypothetical protein Hanom_Chr06g00536241 [Helianthus anomalus]